MSSNNLTDPAYRAAIDACEDSKLYLNGYVVTRIVYELIKNYMISNTPADCGVTLAQSYNIDPTKSSIFIDIGYNWRSDKSGKVPAVYIQRGPITLKNQTIGTITSVDVPNGTENRRVFCDMPVIVSCVAAEPIAVVENLAEYVKQPLLCFRKEVEVDFGLRRLMVNRIEAPKLDGAGKNNFVVDIQVQAVFDEGWIISRESLKLRRLGVELFDSIMQPLQSFNV